MGVALNYYVVNHAQPWVVTLLCTIWGVTALLVAILLAILIANDLSFWREKIMPKLPASFQENTAIRRTITAIIVIVPALTWPIWVAIVLPLILIGWVVGHIYVCLSQRRESKKQPDLEMGPISTPDGEHQAVANEQEGQTREQTAGDTEGREISLPAPTYAPNSNGGGYAQDFKLLGGSSKASIQLPCRKDISNC